MEKQYLGHQYLRHQLWVVGQVRGDTWEIQGVFDDKTRAVGCCQDENWFIGPVRLNEPFPSETVEWQGAFFPKNDKETNK